VKYYNPNDFSDFTWDYVYSTMGRTRIPLLTTRNIFVGANGGKFTMFVSYGNTKPTPSKGFNTSSTAV
jgi:hypothetical protein